jgi:hypothetical protein
MLNRQKLNLVPSSVSVRLTEVENWPQKVKTKPEKYHQRTLQKKKQ